MAIQVFRGMVQILLRKTANVTDDPVVDHPGGGNEHHEDSAAVQPYQVDSFEHGLGDPGRGDQAGVMGNVREGPGGLLHDHTHVVGCVLDPVEDERLLIPVERLGLHQGIHIVPKPAVRRDPAGGGVGLFQKTEIFETRHDASHRGRAHVQTVLLRDLPGAHRLGPKNVVPDDSPQDLLRSCLQAFKHHADLPVRTERPNGRSRTESLLI